MRTHIGTIENPVKKIFEKVVPVFLLFPGWSMVYGIVDR